MHHEVTCAKLILKSMASGPHLRTTTGADSSCCSTSRSVSSDLAQTFRGCWKQFSKHTVLNWITMTLLNVCGSQLQIQVWTRHFEKESRLAGWPGTGQDSCQFIVIVNALTFMPKTYSVHLCTCFHQVCLYMVGFPCTPWSSLHNKSKKFRDQNSLPLFQTIRNIKKMRPLVTGLCLSMSPVQNQMVVALKTQFQFQSQPWLFSAKSEALPRLAYWRMSWASRSMLPRLWLWFAVTFQGTLSKIDVNASGPLSCLWHDNGCTSGIL